jgi:hypothetical protein
MYVSITGLTPKGLLGTLRFWMLAVPSFRQAQTAPGNLFCEVRRIQNYQCTLTAWTSRDAMLDYLRSGTHLKAMKAFKRIATGKSFGYEADSVPSWAEAFERLVRDGRNH